MLPLLQILGLPSWQQFVMILIGLGIAYLSIAKKVEPYVLLPLSIGIILSNLPLTGILDFPGDEGLPGLLGVLRDYGFRVWCIIPPLIFLGLGAMTDFSPAIANPKTLLLGFAAQLGIFIALTGSIGLGFDLNQAASIAIIGGADGPTTIYTGVMLFPKIVGTTAICAYMYIAMVPLLQPPISKLLTTKEERMMRMKQLRPVSRLERILFPFLTMFIVILLIPSSATLIGMFMFGNIIRESGVVPRLSDAAQNEFTNLLTIFLGLGVGTLLVGEEFLTIKTLEVFALGMLAIASCQVFGILIAKLMNLFVKEKINPLIGGAGISAVPMAARVAQDLASAEDPSNYILMHAMGPNAAGVIGSAAVAGVFIGLLT